MAIDTIKATAIFDGAVDTADLADGAVTTAKIDDSQVTTAKIADSNITGAKIADDAVTAGKLDVGQLGGRRNIIINGAMDFDQRYGGTAHTIPAYTNTYVLDRWFGKAQPSASLFSVQQVAASGDALAAGFEYCSQIASLTNHTQTSGDIYTYMHSVEGLNAKHLQWGTANAKTVTMSFWVKSSKTGTHGGSFLDASNAYTYPFTYSVSSADTWEQKTVTLTGPTSGTFNKTNAIGLQISFGLCVGSSFSGTAGSWSGTANIFGATGGADLLDSSSNTWSITGVQLEVGSAATPFEHRSYGEELALCQRYYTKQERITITTGYQNGTSQIRSIYPLCVPLRANPSTSYSLSSLNASTPSSPDFNGYTISSVSAVEYVVNNPTQEIAWNLSGWSGNDDDACFVWANGAMALDAEL